MSSSSVGPQIEGLTFMEHLGAGGYSDVFLYERQLPRMRVAVKVLKDARLTEGERTQFAAEAETMAELADHPYIVQVFSTGALADGRPYLVMKYYPPPNLGVRCARERFVVADVLRTGIKIASAVETAHRAGILHRDIKPANILVSAYGEPGLTDFGIAGHAAEPDVGDDIGVSIPWSPPEVLTGSSNGSSQSDVYSLSATLWHLLVGRSPFEIPSGDNSPRALMSRVLRTPPPATGRSDVPASLDRLLQHGMAKNPAMRPRTALEFARALQAVEQEQRFVRTEVVLEELPSTGGGAGGGSESSAVGDRTRMRSPTRVTAQPGNRPVASAFAPPARNESPTVQRPAAAQPMSAEPKTTARPVVATVPGPRVRTPGPNAGEAATTLRPAIPAATGDDPGNAAPARRGTKVTRVGLIVAGLILVAVVVGLVLSSGDSGGGAGNGGPTVVNTQADIPPTRPDVSASRDAKRDTVVFTWQYNNVERGDHFVVESDAWQQPRQVAKPRLAIATSHLCIAVNVVRANGQESGYSSQRCWPQS